MLNEVVQFQAPWFLAGLLVLPAAVLAAWHKRRPGLLVGTVEPAQTGKPQTALHRLPLILTSLAVVLLIVAASRPQFGLKGRKIRAEGIDIMVCLDVSGSMKAVDIPNGEKMTNKELERELATLKHKTRLEVAKEQIRGFIQRRPNDRIGLAVFADAVFTACPPTLDHGFLMGQLNAIKIGLLDQYYQTNLAAPIAASISRLKESPAPRRVCILITDGENTVDAIAGPMEVAKVAARFRIHVHTIGVGSKAAFIARDKDMFGRVIWERFSEQFKPDVLKTISETTQGHYRAASDADMMEKVMNEIDELERTKKTGASQLVYRDVFLPVMIAGLTLLLLSFALQRTVLLPIP